MRLGLSIRAFARLIGVDESAVRKAIKAGRIRTLADCSLDPEQARREWLANSDPARTRVQPKPQVRTEVRTAVRAGAAQPSSAAAPTGPDTLAGLALRTAAAAQPRSEFDFGFIAGLLMAAYRVGAWSARLAFHEGVPLETAKRIEPLTTVAFVSCAEALMRGLPTFQTCPQDADLPGVTYEAEWIERVDWTALKAE